MHLKTILTTIAIVVIGAPVFAGEIHEAAKQGELARIKELLREGPSLVNATDDTARTPLHWACRGHYPEVVAYLVEKGADVNARDNNEVAPLHSAAARGYADVAGRLLEAGAEVDPADYDHNTPLHYVCHRGHSDVAGLLLKHGANVEARDSRERTPLILVARQCGDVETGRELLDHGADIDAADKYDGTPLTLSAWRGYGDFVDLLIERGVTIPDDDETTAYLLQYAVSKGMLNLFRVLDERGAELSVRNENGGSLVHSGAQGGDPDIVRRLIDTGLSPNETDHFGWYPIHYAAENGRADAVTVLLENGADIDARNLCGETAYNLAAENQHAEVTGLLATKGADPSPPQFPVLSGPYMGQEPPDDEPVLFARGIVSSKWSTHTPVVFSPDGTEAYWPRSIPIPGTGYTRGVMYYSKVKNGRWTPPARAPFNTAEDHTGDPCFSPDGKRLFFLSSRPTEPGGDGGKENIWVVERTSTGWSEPKPVGHAVNAIDLHWQISVAANGNLYFGSSEGGGYGQNDVYVSRLVAGEYTMPENLGPAVNTEAAEFSPFISPDEDYLMISRSGAQGDLGIYISFRTSEGAWSMAEKMSAPVNTGSGELCPVVSSDGKCLFFLSHRNGVGGVYWMKADIVEKIRSQR